MKSFRLNNAWKKKLEKLYLQEKKDIEEIAKILEMDPDKVEYYVHYFRLDKSRKILSTGEEIKKSADKNRTREECISEFRLLKLRLGRTPMMIELPKYSEGLRRDIIKHFGSFSTFLEQGNFGKPRPLNGSKNKENFQRLASEAAIRYHQMGKWSKSEFKVKRILEDLGLIENLNFWHNFKLKSPFGGTFELDFYLPKQFLVIEVDSFWHDLGESKAKDQVRDEWVKTKLGCETVRFDRFGQKGLARIRKELRKRLT